MEAFQYPTRWAAVEETRQRLFFMPLPPAKGRCSLAAGEGGSTPIFFGGHRQTSAGGRETFRVSGRDLLLPPELAERGGAFLRRGTFCPCKKYPKTRLGDWRPACSPACGGEQRPPPPKNPREFTGGVIRIAWSIRAAHGYRIDESLTTIAIDLVLPSASAAFAACAVLRCCLPVPRDPGFRRPPE